MAGISTVVSTQFCHLEIQLTASGTTDISNFHFGF